MLNALFVSALTSPVKVEMDGPTIEWKIKNLHAVSQITQNSLNTQLATSKKTFIIL